MLASTHKTLFMFGKCQFMMTIGRMVQASALVTLETLSAVVVLLASIFRGLLPNVVEPAVEVSSESTGDRRTFTCVFPGRQLEPATLRALPVTKPLDLVSTTVGL